MINIKFNCSRSYPFDEGNNYNDNSVYDSDDFGDKTIVKYPNKICKNCAACCSQVLTKYRLHTNSYRSLCVAYKLTLTLSYL